MTAPRAREQRRPPSPPDRRGGSLSPYICAPSAAGRPAGSARTPVARRRLLARVLTSSAAGLLSVLVGLALLAAPAHAQDTANVGANWPLKPSDIGVGDRFRLLIVTTDTRTLGASELSDYDAFVRDGVRTRGHTSIRSYASFFQVLGSTLSVNARDHTRTNPTPAGLTGVPIYWLNGGRVADNYDDFYDGSWAGGDGTWRRESGAVHPDGPEKTVATGTVTTGRRHDTNSFGSTSLVCGDSDDESGTFCTIEIGFGTSRPVFGLSREFQVVADGVPYISGGGIAVTSSPSAGGYDTGDVIQITVTFSQEIALDTTNGTPTLRLGFALGDSRNAACTADPDDAKHLICTYTVTADDSSNDGIYIARDSLVLNGGVIHKSGDASVSAELAYPPLPVQSDHTVNRAPGIVAGGLEITSSPDTDSSYATGEVIKVTVSLDGATTVDTTDGAPRLALSIGSNTRRAEYSATDSTATALVFAYPVVAEDNDNDGISIAEDALELNGSAIHRAGNAGVNALLNHAALSTQSGHRVNRTDAVIVSGGVSVISTPRAATETYGAGEVIEIEVEFSTAVNATAGTDFVISVSGRKRAPLLRGNGTDTLVFGYTVVSGDDDDDGIWIGDQDRTLVGERGGDAQTGAITSVATGRAAELTHGRLGTQSGHKVDGSLTPPASTDATLSALSLGAGVTVSQSGNAYTASVANSVDKVTVTATATDSSNATVEYLTASDTDTELEDADTNMAGHQVALDVGDTVFKVKVTAEDGTTTQTYTVTVTRDVASDTAPVWSATMTAGDTQAGHGYDATDTPDTPAIGRLDDDNFDYGSTPEATYRYRVLAIDVATNVVRFVVAPGGLQSDETLTLEFGGHALAFSDRIAPISINQSVIWSVPAALDDLENEFPVGSTATVCLRTATQVCPAGRIVTPSTLPTLSVADAAATEGGDVTFTATLSAAAAADVTATWTASIESGDTAVAADLGTTTTGTVRVTAGQPSGTFDVPTAQDTANEADETFTVTLSGVSTNAALAADATATGTITNDDAPAEPADFQAGVGDAQVDLTWDAPAPGANITRHEYRQKEGSGSYPAAFTPIPASAPGGTNAKGYTVRGLTNEVAHTFELRAVNDAGDGTAAEAGPVTPTPGICGRTQQVRDGILDEVPGVTDCNEVTVANLAAITGTLDLEDVGITSLQSGDFAGLTALGRLYLPDNAFSSLPLGVFSGLTGLTRLYLNDNDDLTSLPDGVFAGLTALKNIRLYGTGLTSLPDDAFDGLTALESLRLHNNQLTSLPDEVFDGLMALETLHLSGNDLSSLPDEVLKDLTALTSLTLNDNDLDALPDGAFTGLTALNTLSLGNNPNSGDDLPLTVTVEKVGTDQARAKVAAGAPFAVEFTPTVVNGSLPASDTKLAVPAGSVNGTAETVTRTSGTTAAVTVDIDLSTQPDLPTQHSGYEFAKATGSEPATVLPAVAGNNPPVFTSSASLSVEENTSVATVVAVDSDADDGITGYAITGGADELLFDNITEAGALWFTDPPNFEDPKDQGANNTYVVTARATSGTGDREMTATQTVTVTVTDVDEKSAKPAKPTLAKVTGSSTSLTASWTKPDLDGGPDITGYALAYREGTTGTWTNFAHSGTGLTTTLTGLTANTSYQARVRAKNGETDSDWSDASDAVKTNAAVSTPTLSIADAEGDEDDGVEFTATLTAGVSGKVTATWTASIESGDTAVAADLATTTTGDVEFDVNATTATFTVPLNDDSTDEPDQTFTLTLSGVSSNAQLAADPTAKGTIQDNDDPPTLSVDDVSGTEGTSLTFTVTLSAESEKTVTVDYATSEADPQSAVSGTDFTAASGTLTFSPGDPGDTTKTITVATTGDTTVETNETFTVTLSNPTNATLGTKVAATGTINDDATVPTISGMVVISTPVLGTDTYGAGETIEVLVAFDEAVNATSDTDFELNVGGGANDRSAPLLRGSGTATLVFGYTVAPGDEDDNGIWIGDQDRTLVGARRLMAQSGTIASVATSRAADLTHDALDGQQSDHKVDGSRSIVSVAVTSTPALETDTYGAGETIRFTVTFNVAVDKTGDPVLRFALGNSGEVRDVDAAYESGSGGKALVFGYTVLATDEDDNGIFLRDEEDFDNPDGPVRLDSNDEIEFKGTSTDVPLYWEGRGTQSGHKVDGSRTTGNNPPSFTSLATFDAAENQTAAGTVAAADSDADDSVTGYAITGGADQALFEIGATAGELTFKSAPNFEDPQDSDTDNGYEVTVQATSGAGTRVMTATQTITVTVTDVDTEAPGKPGAPTVSAGSATSLRVNWSAPSNAGPPITGYDVRHRTSSPEGSWTEKNVPSIAAVIENLSENTSYDVQVRAINAEGTGDWSDSGTGTTDAAVTLPTLSIGNASATEGSIINFPLTLSAVASEIVTAACTASFESGDTAVAADLTGSSSMATIFAGATSGSCLLDTAQDTTDEDDETFTVTLSGVSSNAQLAADPTAKGTIVDDDPLPTLSVNDVSGTEGTSLTFTVTLSAESEKTVTVDYATSEADPQSAVSGTDFTAASGTLTFSPGDPGDTTKTITVATTDDTTVETSETFTLTLSNPGNATISDATAKGTITDADAALPTLSVADAQATEGSPVTFMVSLSAASAQTVTVDWATLGLPGNVYFDIYTADAGDYVPGAGTLTFAPGDVEKTVSVATLEDTAHEEDEPFRLLLSNPTNAVFAGEGNVVLTPEGTILDDDDPPVASVDSGTVGVGGDAIFTLRLSPESGKYAYLHWSVDIVGPDMEVIGGGGQGTSSFYPGVTENRLSPRSRVPQEVGEVYTLTFRNVDDATAPEGTSGSITVVDTADLPAVTIAADDDSVTEESGEAGLTLTRTAPLTDELTVTVELREKWYSDVLPDGMVTLQTNYDRTVEQTVTFAANATTTALAVPLKDDNVAEGSADLTVTVKPGDGYTVGDPASAMVTVTDESDTGAAKPLHLRAIAGPGAGEVVLFWAPPLPFHEVARHEYRQKTDGAWGSWVEIPDSGSSPDSLTAAHRAGYAVTDLTGGQTHTFEVRAVGTTTPSAASNEAMATPRTAGLKVSFGASAYTVDEGGTVEVTVRLEGGVPGRQVTVPVSAAGADGATAQGETGADWSGVPETVTFGALETAKTFTLTATDDSDADAGESVALTFGTLPPGVTKGTVSEATVTIVDDDDPPADANAAPTFSSLSTFDAAENQTAAGTVLATDGDTGDDVTGYAITGGADQAFFSIGATSGALTFDAAPNFEDAEDQGTDNTYVVTVEATSGTGAREKTATQTITVTVTDVTTEAPGKPDAPTVAAASVTSLTVTWSAPANAGPAITDYDVQYRAGTSGDWSDGNHTGATTTATLTGLAENTSHQVQVRATNAEGTGSWSDSGTGATDANAAPAFSSSATFDAAENQTAAGTVLAADGDTGDDVTGYAITGGADQAFFSIGATSGALTFDAAPNFEDAEDQGTNNTYVVEVQATSGTGTREKTATQTITVTVTDVAGEAPGKPDAPTVAAASVTSLTVSWSAPANGGPAITDYDVQYRAGTSGDWSDGNHTGATTTATLTGLAENTSHQVQVRATNAEGTGSWSDSGTGATDANAAPAFSSSATFDAAENQTSAGTVLAADGDTGDDVTGYAITGGADQAFFSIGATSGALTFDAAPNFEDAEDQGTNNTYVVEVQATSGTGTREKTATQTITVTVTDVAGEAPGKPDAPTVSAASVTSLTVTWSAPANAGPAITDYDVQYRAGTSGDWSDGNHTGATTTATLTGLAENTSHQVQVRATNDEGTGSWSDSGTGATDANAAPTFSSSATFDAAENQTSAGTVLATDGDTDDDITGYAITGGADQALFSIGATSGALTFDAAPNFEDAEDADTDNDYLVTVEATSGTGARVKTATQTITVTVTDVAGEAPGKPDAPTVAAASVTSLTVTWSAPANAGPAITDYDVQYRAGTSGDWSDGNHTGATTTATLTGLAENTSHQVQVRATNAEGTGSWSDSGTGATDANAAPAFSSSATFDAAENQTSAGTVLATDGDTDDDITGYAITGGADQALFSIGATSGALTFNSAPNFEAPSDANTDNDYLVTVEATSGTGAREKTATQTITVTVTDVAGEAPGKPDAPDVAAASVTSLTVTWSAPANAGPAIDDYDVQYREGTSGSWSNGNHTGTAVTATLTGLSENTSYQVQVRATNDEGTGSWSDSGSGTTDANAAPTFSSLSTFDAAENQTAAGTVLATDGDTGDDVTGYAITGGADQAFFSIGATSGALTFDAAPNFEDAEDQGTNNTYVVTVEATSGTGAREKTATQTITVTVTDVAGEAPGKPDAPDVAAASVTSLTVTWSAPANAGPAITDYDVQYRAGTSGDWSDGNHTGATTTATLTGLAENTSHQVQVRATNDEGTGSWSDSGTGATDANAAPTFSSSATFDAAENQTSAGTVLAADGDTDDDVTGYAITGGADQALFSIGATSGALTFDAAPNFEAPSDANTDNDYLVTVEATSGTGARVKTATQTITVTVTDVAGEAPGKPDAPTVAAASVTSLTVTWSAPANAGPAITDYDVQYRAGTSGDWSDGNHTGATTTATLTGLAENTSHQVQVRATNAEGTGSWSDSGTGATDANAAPAFSSSATFDAAENQTAAGTVLAADGDTGDDVTGYAITGGADQAFFSIGATSGALTFDAAPNFEAPSDANTDNDYLVTVEATSGTGARVKTATQTITVTVTDVAGEAPGKPAAPTVAAASVTSLTVSWSAPANGGPAITDYDVQYRAGTSGDWSDGNHTGATTTATLTGLAENTSHQVQVRATNAEGTGSWSDSGTGTTDANAAPAFSSSATFDAAENQTAAGTVLATDGDTGDDITGYAITGGSDQAFFSIGATSGALTFDDAPNFEAPSDADTDNDYLVTVEATSGTGARVKTATQTITVTVTDVAGEAPGKPAAPAVAPASVSSLTVTWSAPANAGPAITDYDVQYREGATGDWSDGGHTGAATTATLTGLSENTSYQVQVRATNDEGIGAWSDSGRGATDANAPPPVEPEAEAVEGSYTSLVVSWTAPDTDGGSALTGYGLRHRERPGGDWVEVSHAGTVTTATLTGLEVNTVYEVEVRALYGEMQSVWVRVAGQVRTGAPPPAGIRNVRLVGGPGSDDGVWSTGERVEVEVRYTEPVEVERPACWTLNADGTCRPPGPYMVVAFSSDARPGYGEGLSAALAPYERGSGTNVLTFAYTVGAAEDGARGAWAADSGMLLRGATIRTLEGGDGASIYTNTRVRQVDVVRPAGGAWTAGDTVRVKVRFAGPVQYTPPDEPRNRDEVVVDETGGTPTIGLRVGDAPDPLRSRTARYERGSGTDTLTFEYAVEAGDGRVSAVEVVADSLERNEATIRNEDGYDAELNHLGVLWYSPLALRVRDAAAREGGTLEFAMELARASQTPVTVDYETADGTATAGEDYTAKRGTVTFAPGRTRKTVAVPVLRDGEAEAAETMVLRLSNARSAGSRAPVEVTVAQAEGTIEDVAPEAPSGGLTARFARAPSEHDGKAFTLRIAFSETIRMSGRRLRSDVVSVAGGRATKARAVNGRKDRWDLTVRPDSLADVTVTLSSGAACDTPAAVCTADGKALSHTLSTTVRGPVTVSVADARAREGEDETIDFAVSLSRAAAGRVSVTWATADGSARAGSDYTRASGKLRFAPGETEKTISVPVLDDAHDEGAETFTLRLTAASGAVVADGVATGTIENTDHMPAAWLARFGRTVTDQVLDAVAARLSASRVAGTRVRLAGQALPFRDTAGDRAKTAANDDAGAGADASGRVHRADARDRMHRGDARDRVHRGDARDRVHRADARDRVHRGDARDRVHRGDARDRVHRGDARDRVHRADARDRVHRADARDREAMAAIRDWMAHAGANAPGSGAGANDDWRAWDGNPQRADRVRSRALTGRDFVTGTSFELTGGSPEAGGYAALWGRGAISRFDGREGDLTLDGEVTTGLVGADWAAAPDSGSGAGRWTAGLAVGHARGTGSYREGGNCTGNDGNDGNDGSAGAGNDGDASNPGASGCSGEVESTLTGLWPYAGFRLTDRLSAWAAAGYGAGELTLTPGGETDGPFTADLTMAMGAAGLRGEVLVPPPEGGLALAVKGDTRFTRTQSKAARDADGGRLAAATGDVWLLRLGVEGSRRFALGAEDAGATLTPRFEVGARLDGGDAETGAGADVGAGVTLAAPRHGLMLVLNARGLLAHEASGFRESGASASLTWDPRPATDRGLALTLRQSWGGSPAGGMDALLGRGTLAGLAPDDNGATASAGRLEAELGYGIALFGGAVTATPHLGFGLTGTGRDYRLGWRLTSARKGAPGFTLGLEATRREAAAADAEHGVMLRGAIRW